MSDFDRIKQRGERLKKMMNESLSPDRAWEKIHDPHSPPKRYPNPNFLTNPDVNDPRNFYENGGNDEDEDFYDYLSDEEEKGKGTRKFESDQDDKDDKRRRQHAIDEEEAQNRIKELEKKKKIEELRKKNEKEAQIKYQMQQINKPRVVDPFARQPDPPLVLQLYLRIYGAMYIDPRDISLIRNGEQKLSDMNIFRNTFIQYKDFPKGNKQRTPIFWNTNSPIFNYKAYFPFIVREDMMALLSKFFFVFEVWDQITADKHNCVGFTKLSLSCFFKSLMFQENGLLNTSYFEDEGNAYPMVGFDDNAEIVNFEGKCVGWLKLTCALGSPNQLSVIELDLKRKKKRKDKRKGRNKLEKENNGEDGKNQELERLLRELIDTLKDKSSTSSKREKGRWDDNQLDSLKKLFEEVRLENSKDIKMKVFKNCLAKAKNAKKISKSEFESDLLDNTALNRKAVTNILEVWNYNDNSTYDLDELQNSYLVYCRYCNFAESKIKSIFEKLQAFFSLNEKEEEKKSKKRNDEEDEDETLKNKNIAALWCKDNEMKEGFNLIVDLFKGGGDPDQSINLEDFLAFINSPPWINKDHISLVSMKHEILSKKVVENLMKDFEDAVGEEILTAGQRSDNLVDPLKCYDFHESCNSNGIKVSIWEVFALFESINKTSIDEPDRYHECRVKNILEALDKDEIWQKYEDVELEKRRVLEAKKKKKSDANPRKSLENFNDREDDNELEDGDEEETKEAKKPNAKGKHDLDESGLFDRQDMNDDEDDFGQNMDEEDEIIEILKDDKGKKVVKPDTKPKGIIKSGNKEETKTNIKTPTKPQVKPGIKTPSKPLDKKTPSKPKVEETKQNRIDNEDDIEESAEFIVGKKLIDSEPNDVENSEANKCPKIKHIFEINVKEIRNIPILKKILKDLNRGDKQSELKQENKYIQDVYVKYIFPLDDEQIVSDFLEYSPRDDNSVDFKVSMHSYHSYLLETNKPVAESLRKCGGSFTINLSCLKENKDTNIGNIHMPIDDLIDLALNYEQAKGIDEHHKQSSSSRILFFYGTVFSQREEMLIGKLAVDFIYKREIVEVTSNRISGVSVSNDLYLQKEVYINRKIPLNGYLNIEICDLNDLRNSLDNIEYLMSLYNHPDSRDNMQNRTSLSAKDDFSNKRVENIDRKRALLRIYKEGLNIGVVASVFDETPDLKDHFGTHQTKVIFKTLNPDFKDDHEYRIKMDTSIFEHFKYRSAVFEVRHYFVEESESLLDLGRKGDEISEVDSEFQTENRDYITLGYAKVPLVNLITKSNGVDQDVAVLDNFSQKLGYLRVKMSLNYQSKKKLKIMQNPKEKSVEGQYFLCLSFVELISQNNKYLDTKLFSDEIKHLIFKFKFEENTYQVRYVPDDNNTSHLPLSINVYKMNKMCIIDFEINNESVERAAKPIEIQMWTKVENKRRCMKDVEELIGSVFIDLSALIGKRLNTRIRVEATEIFNSHDGYYTVFNNENDKIYADRLGMSIMLIKNEYKGHKEDLEKMFFTLHNETQKIILDEFDLNLKGHLDIDDLKKAIDHSFKNKNEIDLVYRYLYLLELKNPDSTYYSPLFNVLPPFFKYARRIDKEQIIEFMYKRLSSVNKQCSPFNGFVENNMFRSILECEVNLKEKIVIDFIQNLKPNPLDYSLTTHTMKLKTDYLLLTRKLYEYLLHFGILKMNPEVELSSIEKVHESQLPTYKIPEERKCSLKVSIICGNNVKNPLAETAPPNTYICMNVPFETEEKELRTPVIYRTTFPQWNYEYEIKGISISDICGYLLRNELEFDIYHKKMPTDGMYNNQESVLVGKTYIDASSLVKNPESMMISGYYHIFKDKTDKEIDNYTDTMQATRGQIRIELKVNKPLLGEFDIQDTEKRQHQIVMQNMNTLNRDFSVFEETKDEPEDILQRAVRRAMELRAKHKNEKQKETAAQMRKISRSPEPKPRLAARSREQSDENEDNNIMPASIDELKFKKEMHLKELADMTMRMKMSLEERRPDLDENSPERNEEMFDRESSSGIEDVSDNS